MPTLSRYFVRSALLCMAIGFTLGGLMLAAKGDAVDPRVWIWLPVHIILQLVGWLIQFSLGVAYWILPRIHVGERGRRSIAWAGFLLLQIGLLLTLLSMLRLWIPETANVFGPALILEVTGIALCAVHLWPRIRPTIVRAMNKTVNGISS